MHTRLLSQDLSFAEAFRLWMDRRIFKSDGFKSDVRYLSPKTLRDYETCGRALIRFFGRLKLQDIHLGHLQEYQRARAACDTTVCVAGSGAWEKQCGANRIRKEIDMLVRILTAAKLWGDDQKEEFVRVQRVELDVDRGLDPKQQDTFLRAAASREEWHFILWYANLGLATAAATNELRNLRLGDVAIGAPGFEMIHVCREGAKNKYRVREIPLAGPAVWAMQHPMSRARDLGSTQPHHYLFPAQVARGYYYPCRAMSDSGLKKRWDEVRKAAGLPWFKPYGLRNTGITRMAERGVPIDVAMKIVGHMTMAMHRRYCSISESAARKWMTATFAQPEPEVIPQPRVKAKLPPKKPVARVVSATSTNQFSNGFTQIFSRTS